MREKIELTEEQNTAVLKKWNDAPPGKPPTLLQLIDAAYPGLNYDARSLQGRAVKAFIASRQLKSSHAENYQPKEGFALTEEHREFIINNLQMSPLQIARTLTGNAHLSVNAVESRAVYEFYNSLPGKVKIPMNEQVEFDEYKPPKTVNQAVSRVNLYVQNANLDAEKLNTKHKKDIHSLIGYLHTYRVIYQINTYTRKVDRELFESTFVRYTWDKNDLTEEEIDQNVMAASNTVKLALIDKHITDLQVILDEIAQKDNGENKKFSMGLVEAISQARKEQSECEKRIDTLLKNLVGTRAKRMENKVQQNASILNLVELWKEEESRLELIKIAEMELRAVEDDIERFRNLDDVKAKILGISEDEIKYG